MRDWFKLVGWIVASLLLLFAVLFATGAMGNFYESTIGRQSLNVQRENYERSKPYVHGKIQDLARYKREYERATSKAEKEQVRAWVLNDFANFDKSLIDNRDLYNFLLEMERGVK